MIGKLGLRTKLRDSTIPLPSAAGVIGRRAWMEK
jgi:hypothetical protein